MKNKLRFTFNGRLTTEDLWDLNTTQLSQLSVNITKLKSDSNAGSLIKVENDKDKEIEMQLEIIKYIFETKNAEIDAAQKATKTKENNQKIMAIIDMKKNNQLLDMDIEELESMIIPTK